MEYGRVIKRAIDVTWRHKSLWVFGIAAALFGAGRRGRGGGGGSGLQHVFRGEEVERWRQRFPSFGWPPGEPWSWPQVPPFYWEELAPIIIGALAVASVRVKRCPDCGASRLLKNGTSVAFCLDCGHWFDPRISA